MSAPDAALEACLVGYQNPVPEDVLEFQMRIASAKRPTWPSCPPAFRKFAAQPASRMSDQAFLPGGRVQCAAVRHAGSAELVRRSPRSACSARSSIPALWLIGLGLEGAVPVDALAATRASGDGRCGSRRETATGTRATQRSARPLRRRARRAVRHGSSRAHEISDLLTRTGATESQIARRAPDSSWLHLKLLAARASLLRGHRRRRARAAQPRRAGARAHRSPQPRRRRRRAASAASSSSSK